MQTVYVVHLNYGDGVPQWRKNLFATLTKQKALDFIDNEKQKLLKFQEVYERLEQAETAWEELHPCPAHDAPEFLTEPILRLPVEERNVVHERNQAKRLSYARAVDKWSTARYQYLDGLLTGWGVDLESDRVDYIESLNQCDDRKNWNYQFDAIPCEE